MRQKSDLRSYQQRTITKLYESDVVQAVLPMGAGKTASALTAIKELIDDGVIRCAIVLAPKRVAQLVWPKEPQEWAHLKDMRVRLVAGTPTQRTQQLVAPADIYVVGINLIPWLVEQLKELRDDNPLFDLLLIDELSRFKSPTSKRANKHLGKIIDRWDIRWGMTGTPRPNGYEDQYRPLQLLTANMHFRPRTFDRWRTKHFMQVDKDGKASSFGFKWVMRPEHESKIIKQIGAITFTVPPEEMPELPELVPVPHWVELPPAARKLYKDMEAKLFARFQDNPGILAANAAVASGKLSQIIQGFLYEDGNSTVQHLHSVKADLLVDMVEGLSGLPTLIAYEFIEDLRVLREMWPGLPYLGAGVSDKDAAKHEIAWNRGELPLLAVHPASAGHGLNLQFGGSQVIWYGLTWSAELYDQLIKRFHRPGQIHRCFSHMLMARDTIDEVKYDRVIGKMADQEAFNKYMRRV